MPARDDAIVVYFPDLVLKFQKISKSQEKKIGFHFANISMKWNISFDKLKKTVLFPWEYDHKVLIFTTAPVVFITAKIAFIFTSLSAVQIYDFHILTDVYSPLYGFIWNQHNDQFPVGLLAQLVERYTDIAEVMSSNLVQAWIFFRPFFHYYSSSVHYCKDHFHILVFICISNIWLSYIHSRLLLLLMPHSHQSLNMFKSCFVKHSLIFFSS